MGSASSLIQASTTGDVKKLEKLLKKNHINVECVSADGCSPLFIACREGHLELIPHLLKAEANPNIVNKDGYTPLHVACMKGNLYIVQFLLQYKADYTIFDPQGCSAIIIASIYGHSAVVSELLAAGADVHDVIKYRKGCTSLHNASERGHADVVEVLLEGGADPLVKNDHGLTPLHIGMYIYTCTYSIVFQYLIVLLSLQHVRGGICLWYCTY